MEIPKVFKEKYIVSNPDKVDAYSFYNYYEPIAMYNLHEHSIEYIGDEGKCRYCGTTDRSKFKKKNAHSFPEGTGNKTLFSKDECVDCNDFFSIYENEFLNHGKVFRAFYGSKTKKNKSLKHNTSAGSMKKDDGKIKLVINSKKSEKSDDSEMPTTISVDFENKTKSMTTLLKGVEYSPSYLYKSLCKFAFSIMPNSELNDNNFDDFKKVLLGKELLDFIPNSSEYFKFFVKRTPKYPRNKPVAILFKKSDVLEKEPLPTYTFYFNYLCYHFQIFLPVVKSDEWILENIESIRFCIIDLLVCKKDDGKGVVDMVNGLNNKHRDKDFRVSAESWI